jgi:hypothetical protein
MAMDAAISGLTGVPWGWSDLLAALAAPAPCSAWPRLLPAREAETMKVTTAVLCFGAILAGAAHCAPVEDTAYGRSALRLEVRPDPTWFEGGVSMANLEGAFAGAGVGARWLSVMDPLGQPYYASEFIPTTLDRLDERERMLKDWVREIHARGMAAMSWYPLAITRSGVEQRPEWRQQCIEGESRGLHRGIMCCPNTAHGDAVINFCIEAISRFDLDGIWFDGSAFNDIWDRPTPLACRCPACQTKFREATGLTIPERVDWSDPTFRRWVAWRYDVFCEYIGRLSRAIRKAHPNAAVVINHYHRPRIPWQGAIPLDPYDADIITGSEATGEAQTDLTMRLCRAYGRSQCEVWMPLTPGNDPDSAPETDDLVHHALTCVTAGGLPSFGTGPDPDLVPRTARHIAEALNPVRPYIGGESVPYAALHVSQQTETFYFSREPKGLDWSFEPYFASLAGWTQGLMGAHVAPDYIYDANLTGEGLSRYRVLLAPWSVALSAKQAEELLDFARQGGVVVLGPGAGGADDWGELVADSPLASALSFRFERMPTHALTERQPVTLTAASGDPIASLPAIATPVELGDGWQTLWWVEARGARWPGLAVRDFGRGKVAVLSVDLGWTASDWQPVAGGETSLTVTDETAARGRRSLRFVDGKDAPYPFCPDMEMHFPAVGAPLHTGLSMRFAVKLSPGARVRVEMRDSAPKLGPGLSLGRDGKAWVGDVALCDVPTDAWVWVEITARIADDRTGFDLTLTMSDGTRQRFSDLPFGDAAFAKCDWAVIYGDGDEAATFYVDEVEVEGLPADRAAPRALAFCDGFETNGADGASPAVSALAALLGQWAPAPVRLAGPAHVRVGAFHGDGDRLVVHLHNLHGSHVAPRPGEAVRLWVTGNVKSARGVLSGRGLATQSDGGGTLIQVPEVALHEVVIINR